MMKLASIFGGKGEAKKQPVRKNELKEINMNIVTKLKPKTQAGTVAWLNECVEKSQRGEFGEAILLTPGLAGELLRRNPDNRNIRHIKTQQFANDIKNGNWQSNGETIIISTDGLLNDGQHRCAAVVEANCPIEAAMWFGVNRDSRLTIDQGSARGAGDYLSMEGVKNGTICSVIARLAIAYERSNGVNCSDRTITNSDIMARVHSDADIHEAASFASKSGKNSAAYVAATVIGFCYYVFSEIDGADAKEFLGQVTSGEGLKHKDPALVLREKMILMPRSREPKIAAIFRAWNFYRRGMPIVPNALKSSMPFPALV